MEQVISTSRFAGVSRRRAAVVLSLTVLALFACLIASRTGKRPPMQPGYAGWSDPDVLYIIVSRVHRGENYYDAAGAELRAREYSLRSVFNWRQPLYAWFLGAWPTQVFGRVILIALALLTIFLAIRLCLRLGDQFIAVICLWMFSEACYGCFCKWGPTELEVVTGIFIALSIFTYASDQWFLGLAVALVALFTRELAAPYVIVCVMMAVLNKRWTELLSWAAGLALYAAYFAYHVAQVHAHILPSDIPSKNWIDFGGLHFILTTAGQHLLLIVVPLWVIAIYLPLSLLGIAAIPGDLGRRIAFTVGLYILFFAIGGRPVNDYWGFVYGPLLAFGFAWSPLALFQLVQAASRAKMPLTEPPGAGH